MKFSIEDIKFESITPREIENLCYDLLLKYNFMNLIWRKGGADNGRDIEADLFLNSMIKRIETKWFFECKHYTSGGVSPDELNSKIAWADAENPKFLVFFVSSYLTNNARTWLDKIASNKTYEIIVIEGEEIKNRILKFPELVERYFSLNRYDKLFKDVRDYKIKFNIAPSYEFLTEIIKNTNLEKLTTDEIGFILINFYHQYSLFELRNDYYGDFDESVCEKVLDYLKSTISNERLESFNEYLENYDVLGGTGLLEEMYWLDDEENIHDMKKYNFQSYDLHLNHLSAQDKWKIGYYLFIIHGDVAFEIFEVENTEIRIIKDFKPERIKDLSLNLSENIVDEYKLYLENFSA